MTPEQTPFSSIGYLQFAVQPGQPEENLDRVRHLLSGVEIHGPSLVVLPELWGSGLLDCSPARSAAHTSFLLDKCAQMCSKHDLVLAGSLVEEGCGAEQGNFYNTTYIVGSEGVYGSTRKTHLFDLWGENKWFAPGCCPRPVQTPHGAIGALVCYDLRFPGTPRLMAQQSADILIFSAQWPASRIDHYHTLLTARAIENQIWVVGCNATGTYQDQVLGGRSTIINPLGERLTTANAQEQTGFTLLSKELTGIVRQRFSTISSSPYLFDDKDKIVSLAEAGKIIKKRRSLGQKVICCEISEETIFEKELERLLKLRQACDFLVVCPGGGKGRYNARTISALGCVDLVPFTADGEYSLVEICSSPQ